MFQCLPVQAWRSLCTKPQGTLWSVPVILLKWAAFVVWQTWKLDSLNLFHGPLPFLWSVLGARGAVSTTVSNLFVPVSPSAKTFLLAMMNSVHSSELGTNGNTEFVGQSKDKYLACLSSPWFQTQVYMNVITFSENMLNFLFFPPLRNGKCLQHFLSCQTFVPGISKWLIGDQNSVHSHGNSQEHVLSDW